MRCRLRYSTEAFVVAALAALSVVGDVRAEEAVQTVPRLLPATLGGYAEAFYQWNFNQPANGITNYRGFDNPHNRFTISNVALDASWDINDVVGKLTLRPHERTSFRLEVRHDQAAGKMFLAMSYRETDWRLHSFRLATSKIR